MFLLFIKLLYQNMFLLLVKLLYDLCFYYFLYINSIFFVWFKNMEFIVINNINTISIVYSARAHERILTINF